MPQVTCSRCFAVFDADDARPGVAPLCPSCASRMPQRAGAGAQALPAPVAARRRGGGLRRAALAGGVVTLLAVAAGGLWLSRRSFAPAPAAPAAPGAVELLAARWLASGEVPPLPPAEDRDAFAREKLEAARRSLADDRPERSRAALADLKSALAAAPASAEAAAAYATAFAASAGEDPDGPGLRTAHEVLRAALDRHPSDPMLLAAQARLLLLVPSASNDAEALALSGRAVAVLPREPSIRLAAGLSLVRRDPAAAALALENAAADAPADTRLVLAAGRARWAAGDPAAALALAARPLSADPGHPGALALRAEVEAGTARYAEARATLERWAAADRADPRPPLLLARLAYQLDDDLPAARRLLKSALDAGPDDFTAARILAHRAAVERAAGEPDAAARTLAEALRRVPGSGPARFQAALLAADHGEAGALRESAGVVGPRAGPIAAAAFAAEVTALQGTFDEGVEAWRGVVELAGRDPEALLGAAAALARRPAPGPALEAAGRVLARDPIEARLRRGPTDYWAGPHALAEAARRLAAVARTERREAAPGYGGAAAAELLLGHTREAERLAALAREASPQSAAPLALLAQVSLDRGEPRQALAVARAAVDLRPGDAFAREVKARALEALGRNDEAEQAHRAALQAVPDLASARLGLARHLARRGDAAGARVLLEALLEADPGLPAARGLLLALDEAGRPAAAPPEAGATRP